MFNKVENINRDGTKDIKAIYITCGDEQAGSLNVGSGTIHLKCHTSQRCRLKGQPDV